MNSYDEDQDIHSELNKYVPVKHNSNRIDLETLFKDFPWVLKNLKSQDIDQDIFYNISTGVILKVALKGIKSEG